MAISIYASVGRNGENHKPDTRKIQRLLNAIYPATPLIVDGLCGRKTIRRIERFQRRRVRNPGGRIEPGGRTLERLNQSAPGLQPEWSGDSSKWSQTRKLESLNPRMSRKVENVIDALNAQGFKPKIFYAWRSVIVQRELVDKGRSHVTFSFHNAQKRAGTPDAYAADIVDRRWAWTKDAELNGFWQKLGDAAKAEGLYWGGSWRKFKDWAHVQYYPNHMLIEVKRKSGLA